ncbi:PaaI family thioesterase [Aneurinibacillus tyrosinisolvens]|uniref:PaaI family thioesterase n=1 Tax=Aneurinibacillus tyrosinisolvens TaxID=1443435 RepID=UPI00063EF164|nr:PaaI family thioesterase [Aneurinibacillus tyrosinisolvens]
MRKDQEALLGFFNEIINGENEEEQQMLYLTRQAIEHMRDRKSSYLSGFMGLRGEYLEDGTYRFEVPITPFMLNRHRTVHGGITASLADSVMGSLASRVSGHKVVTTEMNVHYLSPGTGDRLIATAELLRKGSHLCVCQCKIHNEEGRLVLAGSGNFFLLEPK